MVFHVILCPFYRNMAQFTEEEQLMRRITKHFRKGVVNYRLIDDGDVILVGLSGGKDSLALLELLAARARIHRPHFQVRAVHVCMTNIPFARLWMCLSRCTKPRLTRRPIPVSRLASSVRGTVARPSLPWRRSGGATRLPWDTTWTTSCRLS